MIAAFTYSGAKWRCDERRYGSMVVMVVVVVVVVVVTVVVVVVVVTVLNTFLSPSPFLFPPVTPTLAISSVSSSLDPSPAPRSRPPIVTATPRCHALFDLLHNTFRVRLLREAMFSRRKQGQVSNSHPRHRLPAITPSSPATASRTPNTGHTGHPRQPRTLFRL
ncbi:hypothetical protein E2C01_011364 [Portunus trituberculatus]|uniref:Uncharacterized protein n=1 Tax=Portunus trituberculatus TaxID=210409 RepID=A0A5B7DAU5_PORTR|nr:hypothetical protein [Portunus trituberculatus]